LQKRENNFHFIVDINGHIEAVAKNPYWSSISTQPDLEAVYIGVIDSNNSISNDDQIIATESILKRFEGISVEKHNINPDDNKKSTKETKKGKPVITDLSGISISAID